MGLKRIAKKMQKEIIKPQSVPKLYGELLRDKIVLVSGGTSGIGFAIAEACLTNGAKVIITGRSQTRIDKAIKRIKEQVENADGSIRGIELDITDVASISKKVKDAESLFSENRIDVLINSAGVLKGDSLGNTDEKDFDDVLQTNLKGTYFLSQEFANYLVDKEIQGNILNVSSVSAIRPANSPYMISKWGLNGLTKGLAKKYIKNGIVVNGIAPGPTATDMLLDDKDNIKNESSPTGRYVTPEEIANMSVILVSDLGRMIVGDTLYMTGGSGNLTLDDIIY